jgi:hypothetical protein
LIVDDLQWVALARWTLFLNALSALFVCECRVTALLADTRGFLLSTRGLIRTEQVASWLCKCGEGSPIIFSCIYCADKLGAVDVPVAENPLCSDDAVYKELASRTKECGACAKSDTATFNNKGTSTSSRGAAAGELNMAHSSKAD